MCRSSYRRQAAALALQHWRCRKEWAPYSSNSVTCNGHAVVQSRLSPRPQLHTALSVKHSQYATTVNSVQVSAVTQRTCQPPMWAGGAPTHMAHMHVHTRRAHKTADGQLQAASRTQHTKMHGAAAWCCMVSTSHPLQLLDAGAAPTGQCSNPACCWRVEHPGLLACACTTWKRAAQLVCRHSSSLYARPLLSQPALHGRCLNKALPTARCTLATPARCDTH